MLLLAVYAAISVLPSIVIEDHAQDARQEATILQLQRLYEGLAAALGGAAPERRSRRSGLTLVDHKDKAESHTHWYGARAPNCLQSRDLPPLLGRCTQLEESDQKAQLLVSNLGDQAACTVR